MKIIVYENRANSYECTYIREDGSDEIKIIFDEPFDAKLTVSEKVIDVKSGISTVAISDIGEGEISPVLFLGARLFNLEPFIVKGGALIGKNPDANAVRAISERCCAIELRLSDAERALRDIYEKIETKITF